MYSYIASSALEGNPCWSLSCFQIRKCLAPALVEAHHQTHAENLSLTFGLRVVVYASSNLTKKGNVWQQRPDHGTWNELHSSRLNEQNLIAFSGSWWLNVLRKNFPCWAWRWQLWTQRDQQVLSSFFDSESVLFVPVLWVLDWIFHVHRKLKIPCEATVGRLDFVHQSKAIVIYSGAVSSNGWNSTLFEAQTSLLPGGRHSNNFMSSHLSPLILQHRTKRLKFILEYDSTKHECGRLTLQVHWIYFLTAVSFFLACCWRFIRFSLVPSLACWLRTHTKKTQKDRGRTLVNDKSDSHILHEGEQTCWQNRRFLHSGGVEGTA